MKKTIIEFEDEYQLRIALDSHKFHSCLIDLDNEARSYLKHGHVFNSPRDVLEWLRERINNEGFDLHGYGE